MKEEVFASIVEAIQRVNSNIHVELDTVFDEVGIDSIDYAQIVIEVDHKFSINVLDLPIQWHQIKTVQHLLDIFVSVMSSNE